MLPETEIEEFLRQFMRRVHEVDGNNTARLQQIIRDGAQELQSLLAAHSSEPSAHMGAVAEKPTDQTSRLPTPPKPTEDPGDVFDPQRDISPG